MEGFLTTVLQSRQRPVTFDTQEGAAAVAGMFAEACEAGFFG
jgi:hypothetical protein